MNIKWLTRLLHRRCNAPCTEEHVPILSRRVNLRDTSRFIPTGVVLLNQRTGEIMRVLGVALVEYDVEQLEQGQWVARGRLIPNARPPFTTWDLDDEVLVAGFSTKGAQ